MDLSTIDTNDFLLERYKYILSRKSDLNDKTFKVSAYYQVLLLATGSSFYAINSSNLLQHSKLIYSNGLMILFLIITSLLFFMMIGGMLAWVNVRKDENEILLLIFSKGKGKIKKKDILTWYEFYICVAMIIITGGSLFSYCHFII